MRKGLKVVIGLLLFAYTMSGGMVMADAVEELQNYGDKVCYWGDVNADQKVSLTDANGILKGALGISKVDAKYDAFFENGIVKMSDANRALKVAVGIEPQELVVVRDYENAQIEKEYIAKSLDDVGREGISTGAYVVKDNQIKEMVLARLENSLGKESVIYSEMVEYFEAVCLTDEAVTVDEQVPVLIVADMEQYFDLGVNIHGNGFDWFDTSDEEYMVGTVGPQGCFTAKEEIRYRSDGSTIEIWFAEDTSGKEVMTGEENADLYMSVIKLPRKMVEDVSVEVYGQKNFAPIEVVLEEYSEPEMIKEYICVNKCKDEDVAISTGAYVVENVWFKNKMLERLANSLGEESTVYKELKIWFDEKVTTEEAVEVSDFVPVLVVADMEEFFDIGAEMYGSGFGWHSLGDYPMAAVGPYGYYTARNKLNLIRTDDEKVEIRFVEDTSITEPLTGGENENNYLCVLLLPKEITDNFVINVDKQSDFAGSDILLPEIDFLKVYEKVLLAFAKEYETKNLVLDTDDIKYLTEEQKEALLTKLRDEHQLNMFEASSVYELDDLEIVKVIDGDWYIEDGYWIDLSSARMELDTLIVYGWETAYEDDVRQRFSCKLHYSEDDCYVWAMGN